MAHTDWLIMSLMSIYCNLSEFLGLVPLSGGQCGECNSDSVFTGWELGLESEAKGVQGIIAAPYSSSLVCIVCSICMGCRCLAHLAWSLEVEVRNSGDRPCSRPRIATALETRRYSVKELWRVLFFELLICPTPDEHNASKNTYIVGSNLGIPDPDWMSICDNDFMGKTCRISTPSIQTESRTLAPSDSVAFATTENRSKLGIYIFVNPSTDISRGWWHRGNAPPSHGGDPGFDSLSFHAVFARIEWSVDFRWIFEVLCLEKATPRDFERCTSSFPLVVAYTYKKGALHCSLVYRHNMANWLMKYVYIKKLYNHIW